MTKLTAQIWAKLSTMEKRNNWHLHRDLGMIFLVMSLAFQIRLVLFGLMSGSYELEGLLESKMGRYIVYGYGLAGLALPLSGLFVFRHHLYNKRFNKEKGNTLDTVIVNLYFQIGSAFIYFRQLPDVWPSNLAHPVIDWIISIILFAGFDFVVAPHLYRQSLREDGLFLSRTKNYLVAVGMLMNKWIRQLMFAAVILGGQNKFVPAYWALNFATNSLFTFPMFMFFYTIRMKRLLSLENLDRTMTVFSVFSVISGLVTSFPLTVGNWTEHLSRGALVLLLSWVNVKCGRVYHHIIYNGLIAILLATQAWESPAAIFDTIDP